MVSGLINDLIRGLGRRPVGDVRHLPRILRPRPGGLIRLLERDMARDPGDAPPVDVRADVNAQELRWELDWVDWVLGP